MIFNIDTGRARTTPTLNASYPANATIVKGKSVTCEVRISTDGYPSDYSYQWYKNGSAVSGATSSTYTFTPTAVGTTTVYCKVTNSTGTVQSRTATITTENRTIPLTSGWSQAYSAGGGWANGTVTCGNRLTLVSGGTTSFVAGGTSSAYDLKNAKSIEVTIDSDSTGIGGGSGSDWVAVVSSKGAYWDPGASASTLPINILASTKFTKAGKVTLDVSSINSSAYIVIMATRVRTIYCSKVSIVE